MTKERAWLIAGMLVRTGRGVPPEEWVDELVAEAEAESLEQWGPA